MESSLGTPADEGLEAAMRALSSISATLSESYSALETRTQRIERELEHRLAELDAVHRHLTAVLDALPCGVVVRDAEGCVVRVNAATEHILGVDAAELVGARAHPRLDESGARDVAHGWRERELDLADGERRVLASRRSPVPGQGSVEILDDRTELVELSERLHALDKLAALGNMAGGIAHELRNPMHAAAGFAALLVPRLAEDSRERHFAVRIAQSLANAEAVLASMLTLAAPQRLVPETLDVAALVDESVALALEAYVPEGEPSPWTVECRIQHASCTGDRIKLRQALRNLIGNAIDVQPAGGRVRVEARRAGDALELAVGDAGPGVAPELRGRVLEPFFTTRAEGTGLGLPLVATIADLHGGRLELSPRPCELGGARFTILLPLVPNASA
ncbi:MAG TPA: ATP-binding protein [Planctomycetota bacterium]|nr:ATP-binding protein [Planctomycetota bacterium]